VNLTNCTEYIPPATAPTGTFPAYVRFCKTQADALAPGAVTGTSGSPATNRCQLKYVNITGLQAYIYPRYGWFTRDTITSGVASYGNRTGRSDCASPPTCTYTEEIQNYAKWYAYYRTRMQMMKTSAGRSFLPFISNPSATPPKPDRLRVGFITINPTTPNGSSSSSSNVHSSKYLRIDTFNATNAASWYNKFYPIIPDSSTPLRLALSRAGWIFAGNLGTGLTSGILPADDPIQASCQKNYAFLTTDGFWNQGTGQDLAGNAIGNLDNVDNQLVPPYVSPNFMVSRNPTGTFDGNLLPTTVAGTSRGGSGTLADVAMYYYKTDLRPAGSTSPNSTPPDQDVSTNNVQAKSGSLDFATHQHMNTYTIGLADGLMRYQADYDDPTKPSDFNSIKNGLPAAGNCFWTTGTCNWPTPQADGQSALDDLWHAAANGRGRFYSAINPNALSTGLSGALNNLNVAVASAAAAATSSPQVSQAGSKAFSTTYQTSTWAGEVYAQNIDPQSGVVLTAGLPNDGKVWEAQKKLVARVANNIPRDLRTFDPGDKAASPSVPPVASKLKDFKWTAAANGALSATEKTSYFMNKCLPLTTMAQCNTLTPVQLAVANNGTALVDFLSGKPTFEGTAFRDRTEIDATGVVVQTILGDIVNSQPVFVRPPFFRYDPADPSGRGGERIPELPGESYNTFKANNATRNGPLLIGANDGFLHAFNPDSTPNGGEELWAYVPRFLLPALYQLADSGYPGQHRFYVDGTPEVGDVLDETERVWKTIVVGGVNSGGRGFYALDITSPTNPKGLWEFCSSPTLCPDDYFGNFPHSDPDLGLSYGNPVIGRRASDGKWVVVLTSGLNNTGTSGNGKGYFYVLDAITGKILHKIEADDGTAGTTSPSGLMKIGAYYPTGLNDPQFTHVYGGDQFGRVWRVNFSLDPKTSPMPDYPAITTGAPFVKLMATLKDADGRIQPLTARPAGTHLGADPYNPTTRIYYVGTGRYVGNSDLADPGPSSGLAWRQSIYGIRDQVDNPRAGYNPASSFRAAGANFAVEQTLGLSGGGPGRTITKNNVDWSKQDGFFIDLNPRFPGDPPEGNSPGERIVLDVRLILGTLIFTSTIPRSGCEPGGESFQYFLDFRTGGYVGNDSTVVAGVYIGSFLVGTAIEQTSDDLVKALNKTVAGDNRTAGIPVDPKFKGERFSYRER
jgi:type IV pilus assembly protein PilY1